MDCSSASYEYTAVCNVGDYYFHSVAGEHLKTHRGQHGQCNEM